MAVKKKPKQETPAPVKQDTFTRIGAGQIRGVVVETMCRVYEEMWPGMSTHDPKGNADIEIAEETYILTLTMLGGNTTDEPRRGLKIREAEISKNAEWCADHE